MTSQGSTPNARRRRMNLADSDATGTAPLVGDDQDSVGARAAAALDGGEDVGEFRPRALLGPLASAIARSGRVTRESAGLGVELAKVAIGRSTVEPARGDWRFKDPAWRENPAYRRLGQTYLAASGTLERIVDSEELDWKTAERAELATSILTSALSPTNTVAGNPAALKRAFETGGASLVRGTRSFVRDLRHNHGMPQQADTGRFTVGENLAATSGAVVYRDDVCEVIHYRPSTPEVRARPILLIPPQIGRYYFMDLAPGRSFVEYALSRGLQFFLLSWRNPTAEQGDWNLDTYAAACLRAIDAVTEITGSDDLNTIGLCAGGILLSTVLSAMASESDERVNAASFGVTLLDFSVPTTVGMFLSPRLLRAARRRSTSRGVLDGDALGRVFSWLRPNELVWNYWVNNYLMGNDPPAFDILAWNSHTTRLPGALHAQLLDIFEHNLLCTPGALTVLDHPVDLGSIQCDTYVTGALTDHLTPWKGCYRTTQLVGGDSTFVLSSSGHIASLVNPPGNPKSKMFVGPRIEADPDAWLAAAGERTGSWWEHWADWMIERSGALKPAPAKLGSRKHKAGEPAPGSYVHSA
ncbi:MAG TPA: alpha/beta fold hydrolase [Acidimicrobiia bacterium]|nr:alpha/beta fold hydrolase [Acidimicrobiia bacterium]